MRLPSDEAGRGQAVVLLHARPADRTMWRAVLPVLADAGCRAIALDLPGYGEAPAAGHGVLAPWSDVLETLDDLAADRFVLAGNSLGALVALQVAVTVRDRVDALVLVGYRPHDQPPSAELQAAWAGERTALAAGDIERAVQAGVAAWTSPGAPAEIKEHAASMLRHDLELQLTTGEVKHAGDPLSADPADL